METKEAKLCPSATCSSDATLLGIVQDDNTITLLNTPLKLNEAFVEKAREYGEPERRFRFANKCVKNGCKQWTGKSCGIIEELTQLNPTVQAGDNEELPPCIIRKTCRWFSQEGGKACKICLFVVTQSQDNP
jgi:hypothetical protein